VDQVGLMDVEENKNSDVCLIIVFDIQMIWPLTGGWGAPELLAGMRVGGGWVVGGGGWRGGSDDDDHGAEAGIVCVCVIGSAVSARTIWSD
jgi:hypothetical protein